MPRFGWVSGGQPSLAQWPSWVRWYSTLARHSALSSWSARLRVLLRYLVLAVLVAGSMALVFLTVLHVGYHPAPSWWLGIVPAIAMSYWIVILAHLIGRFYPDNEERLDWDI